MCFYVTGHEVDPTVINVSVQNFNSSWRLWLTKTRGVNDGEFRERKELVGDLSQ
ncbi:hypothetical protein E1A91_A12G044600v1 [Gossypium mustelinum]|uniref:Uncharacterized protein n=1 Tax=Gossypium mustelinum TaxID=34275 RepID=A0A5D2WQ17_GOSMU|nr:hypothetical protein E1A91_A12G044600v1 [Gossypium mustelinum]